MTDVHFEPDDELVQLQRHFRGSQEASLSLPNAQINDDSAHFS